MSMVMQYLMICGVEARRERRSKKRPRSDEKSAESKFSCEVNGQLVKRRMLTCIVESKLARGRHCSKARLGQAGLGHLQAQKATAGLIQPQRTRQQIFN